MKGGTSLFLHDDFLCYYSVFFTEAILNLGSGQNSDSSFVISRAVRKRLMNNRERLFKVLDLLFAKTACLERSTCLYAQTLGAEAAHR